ncbi:hypothetical protein BO82DRAFT_24217 [Aspergillus uvarum CBS 121591]|uniref:Uncharacterized protein n=1 Tax=Aspergillus uvarum CBS 121591 TaxID=1448315 RepID=A0A319CIN2_9EURO|nr:hypothetical protein BO82DRAFT_24217 [Aspergillus uvarum CBS 121591]PYH84189.1 hypothetical protein BO82DRAFT_24217 [Aspergillus uvarum CBS 121591]
MQCARVKCKEILFRVCSCVRLSNLPSRAFIHFPRAAASRIGALRQRTRTKKGLGRYKNGLFKANRKENERINTAETRRAKKKEQEGRRREILMNLILMDAMIRRRNPSDNGTELLGMVSFLPLPLLSVSMHSVSSTHDNSPIWSRWGGSMLFNMIVFTLSTT